MYLRNAVGLVLFMVGLYLLLAHAPQYFFVGLAASSALIGAVLVLWVGSALFFQLMTPEHRTPGKILTMLAILLGVVAFCGGLTLGLLYVMSRIWP